MVKKSQILWVDLEDHSEGIFKIHYFQTLNINKKQFKISLLIHNHTLNFKCITR